MSSEDYAKRLRALYSGRVQGVGFRYTVVELARKRAVTGYVKNVWNGDVELVVEGSEQEMLKLLNDIRDCRLGRYVTGERLAWDNALNEFDGFEVRY